MARTRFVGDAGLTVRMTTVMFLLGALFVALVATLMTIAGGYGGTGFAVLVGLAGIGVAVFQWWRSDTVAMRAMRAREVGPEQAPELHAMIDRLCVLADMPKPRVGVADTSMPNAFARRIMQRTQSNGASSAAVSFAHVSSETQKSSHRGSA